jgi:magnesium transporter
MMDIFLSSVSNKMNNAMKMLSVFATVFIPLTLVAGIYGMNFEHMPELKWRWGYPAALIFMLVVGMLILFWFRKKKII